MVCSFIYPGNWSEQNSTILQSQLGSSGDVLAVVGDGSNYKFGFAKLKYWIQMREWPH